MACAPAQPKAIKVQRKGGARCEEADIISREKSREGVQYKKK
jgi:hypothetical protein